MYYFRVAKVFFGQIWSQKLRSSRLTENLKFSEIWYSGISLYAYYDFNFYFFKIIFIHIFLGKFGPKILSPLLKLTEIL